MKIAKQFFAIAALGIASALVMSPAFSQEKAGHSHEKIEAHGGTVLMTKQHHFEVVFKADAVRVYLYDARQKPMDAKGVNGTVTLKFKNGETKEVPLRYVSAMHQMAPAAMDEHHEKMQQKHEEKEHEHSKMQNHAARRMQMDYLQARVDLSKVKPGSLKAIFSLKNLPNKQENTARFTATFNGLAGQMEEHHKEGGHKH